MEIIEFDSELIRKYDIAGPRYTSYPTAPQFSEEFDEGILLEIIDKTNREMIPSSLSLYVHIPFCDTICYYCACNKIITKDHSRVGPYLLLLKQEMEMISQRFDPDRSVSQIHLGGGTPTFFDDNQLQQLMDMIEDIFTVSPDCEKSIELDPRKISDESIVLLTRLGFNRISLGVQDFDLQVQKAVNRVQSFQLVKDRLNAARFHGIKSINMDLIYGLPLQTVESFHQTLEKVIELKPDRLSVFNYAHLPERFKPQRRINPDDLPSPEQKLDILNLCIRMLQQAGYVYIGMDHFALEGDSMLTAQHEGTLQRNFQGYSTHAQSDLVGIGVSAISNICDSYSQNPTTMEAYQAAIQQNRLPVFRGMTMSLDDRIRQAVISQLICHFKLDIAQFEKQWKLSFKKYFSAEVEALVNFEADGLLRVSEAEIKISQQGRLLVRNICMVFDAYIGKKNIQYSRAI